MPPLLTVVQLREHVETDLVDSALQRLLDDADEAIVSKWGPHIGNLTEIHTGIVGVNVHLHRQAKTIAEVKEVSGGVATVLVATDFRQRFGGWTLERLPVGTKWAEEVQVIYTPVSDVPQRTRMTIDLVRLANNYEGLRWERVGDHQAMALDYERERERLLDSLAPGGGLVIA